MSKILQNKIDFCVIISVDGANPNGDPLNGNRPRTTYEGNGEISDVCIKRKIRNRLQDMGEEIFVQSNDRCDDGYKSLGERIKGLESFKKEFTKKKPNADIIKAITCKKWIDVRSFGAVFPFKGLTVSTNVRGCVSLGFAKSLDFVHIKDFQITKSTNLNETEDGRKDKTTLVSRSVVEKSCYVFYGSIHVQLAEINGFTEEDAEKIHQALITLFRNDESAARPSGTINVQRVYWWKHNNKDGQYPPIKVFKTLEIKPKKEYPFFAVTEDPLPNLPPEVYCL